MGAGSLGRVYPVGSFAGASLSQRAQMPHIVESVQDTALCEELNLAQGRQPQEEVVRGLRAGVECLADEGFNGVDVGDHEHRLAFVTLLQVTAGGTDAAMHRAQGFTAGAGHGRIREPLGMEFGVGGIGLGESLAFPTSEIDLDELVHSFNAQVSAFHHRGGRLLAAAQWRAHDCIDVGIGQGLGGC